MPPHFCSPRPASAHCLVLLAIEDAIILHSCGAPVGNPSHIRTPTVEHLPDVPEETAQQPTKEKAMSMDPTSRPPSRPSPSDGDPEGASGRRRLEHPRPRTGRAGLYPGQHVAEPSEFLVGREAIVPFLQRKSAAELDYRLIKELWACLRPHRGALRV